MVSSYTLKLNFFFFADVHFFFTITLEHGVLQITTTTEELLIAFLHQTWSKQLFKNFMGENACYEKLRAVQNI